MSLPPVLSEPGRLAAVARTGLLGDSVDPLFDRLARLAARMFGTPVSFVGLVALDRERFLGQVGLPARVAETREFPIEMGVCRHVVERGSPLIVRDASVDPLLSSSPLLRLYPTFAYAGLPLRVGEEVVGAFCAVDTRPRAWTGDSLDAFEDLAALASADLERRTALREAERSHELLASHQLVLADLAAEQSALRRVASGASESGGLFAAVAEEAAQLAGGSSAHVVRRDSQGRPEVLASWPEGAPLELDPELWEELGGGRLARVEHAAGAPVRRGLGPWGAIVVTLPEDGESRPGRLRRLADLLELALAGAGA
jgi:hypothetical protein